VNTVNEQEFHTRGGNPSPLTDCWLLMDCAPWYWVYEGIETNVERLLPTPWRWSWWPR